MIPLSTTTITVSARSAADLDDEPYQASTPGALTPKASKVRAVIDRPGGREQLAGGEQNISDFLLSCDPTPIDRLDVITDDTTGIDYRVVWVLAFAGMDAHVEAGLRLVEGET